MNPIAGPQAPGFRAASLSQRFFPVPLQTALLQSTRSLPTWRGLDRRHASHSSKPPPQQANERASGASSSPLKANVNAKARPSSANEVPEMKAEFSFKDLGANRAVKSVVVGFLLVAGSLETYTYGRWAYGRWNAWKGQSGAEGED